VTEVRFHFDPISPYAFLAWTWVGDLCAEHGARLVPVPTLLAGLLHHWGQLGPAEVPPKRLHVFKHVARLAAQRGLPLTGPACHPFNPVTALRVCLPEVAGADQVRVVDAMLRATWCARLDPSDPAQLAAVLDRIGLDGDAMVARTQASEVKRALRDTTTEAIAAGVFGVPTIRIGSELFWGDDQRAFVDAALRGEDLLDPALVATLDALPVGATRRR
jgi:2-hydroxychromene-2-carboxylate isomerase